MIQPGARSSEVGEVLAGEAALRRSDAVRDEALLLGAAAADPDRGVGGEAKTKVREIQWVVLEEPEMGLHPKAIVTIMALALDLLNRGYRVLISTHSPVVLDIVWALQTLQSHGGTAKRVARLFHPSPAPKLINIGGAALKKRYRTYSFDFDSADPPRVVGFSSHVATIVGEALDAEARRR